VNFLPSMHKLVHPKVCAGLTLCGLLAAAATTTANAYSGDNFFQFEETPREIEVVVSQATSPAANRFRRGRSNLGADLGEPAAPNSLSGGANISWNASAGCLNGQLRAVLAEVAANFGAITVNSTCRSHSHNAAVGGAAHSYHLGGNAVDFRVHGNVAAVSNYLNTRVGGFKHSGGGLFHIDTGPRRPMN
jgi:Peptidase M15